MIDQIFNRKYVMNANKDLANIKEWLQLGDITLEKPSAILTFNETI